MPHPRNLLEAKKARILDEARKQAAEIDRDLADLERLTSKYGLEVSESTVAAPAPTPPQYPWAGAPENEKPMARAKREGEAIIRAAGKPVPLGVIHDELVARGVLLQGKNPKNILSSCLGLNPNLYSIRHVGWWLKGVAVPPERPVDIAVPANGAGASH